MDKILRRLDRRFRNLSIGRKMKYSFSIPMIIICACINLIAFPIFRNNYQKQLRYAINQSCTQAELFINNYIDNMHYISELLGNNPELKSIIGSAGFRQEKELDVQYREFWRLNNIFMEIEQSNSNYGIGMYVPDDLVYSNNNSYFFPQSALEERADYEEILNTLDQGNLYFANIEEKRPSNPRQTDRYVALFQAMEVEEEGSGEVHHYITKVSVAETELDKILTNAVNTENGLAYLLDAKGDLLASSDMDYCQEMAGERNLLDAEVDSWSEYRLDGTNYYAETRSISAIGWRIVSLNPVNEFHRQEYFIWVLMFCIILALAVAVVVVSTVLARYFEGRLKTLHQKMETLESGDLSTKALPVSIEKESAPGDEFDQILHHFNYMTDELRRLMREHYKLGKNVMSAELRALQAQINPHFLYNTLDLINWGAMDYGADQVALIAQNLGQFYRLSLNHGKSAITIENEMKHVEAYMNIENVHFDGAIHYEVDVPPEVRKYACLNIILQPFVENAIVHGIAENPAIESCRIRIWGEIEEGDILFHIRDDGSGMSQERIEQILDEDSRGVNSGYGVKNINFRIKLCYGDKYGVKYESAPGTGTTVHIRIPAMTYEELDNFLRE